MLLKVCLIILISIFSTGVISSDSILSFPVPEEIPKETKNLLLTITIPSSLPKEPEEEIKEPDFYYYNFNPFPKNKITKDEKKWLRKMMNKGLITSNSAGLIRQNAIENRYNMAIVIDNMLKNITKTRKNKLIDKDVTQEDISNISRLVDEYHKELKSIHLNFIKVDKSLLRIRKNLRAEKGEVKVIKVETDDNGSTMIHLRLNEEDKHIRVD